MVTGEAVNASVSLRFLAISCDLVIILNYFAFFCILGVDFIPIFSLIYMRGNHLSGDPGSAKPKVSRQIEDLDYVYWHIFGEYRNQRQFLPQKAINGEERANMATLYLDPTGNGSPFQWTGTFANVDDGVREPTSPLTADNLFIDNFNEGNECNLTYTASSIAGTITQVDAWVNIPNGEPDLELKINGSSQGYRSSKTGVTTNSWSYYRYTGLSIELNGATWITRHVTGGDEDDEIRAAYLDITYTPAPVTSGVAYPRHIFEQGVIMPPFLGVRN